MNEEEIDQVSRKDRAKSMADYVLSEPKIDPLSEDSLERTLAYEIKFLLSILDKQEGDK